MLYLGRRRVSATLRALIAMVPTSSRFAFQTFTRKPIYSGLGNLGFPHLWGARTRLPVRQAFLEVVD